jgi:hypothetical protein
VTAQQDNMEKMTFLVQIVTGNVLNVIKKLANVPYVEVTEPYPEIVIAQMVIMKDMLKIVTLVHTNVPLVIHHQPTV